MARLFEDLRYGYRALRKSPGFAAAAVLSLALGIGMNTAIFTLVNSILLAKLGYPAAGRLVSIAATPPRDPEAAGATSIPDFFAWQERARSFQSMGAMYPNAKYFGADENGAPAERLEGEDVTADILPLLGVQPLMGRFPSPEECEVDHPAPVLILSYGLWQTRFGGDPRILNRLIPINGVQNTIVGVMPPGFRILDDHANYWAPMRISRFQLASSGRFITVFARLKPEVSIRQAQADMDAVALHLAEEAPDRLRDRGASWGARVRTMRDALFGFMSRPLLLLQGAAGLVLLIACANVAALLLARASGRSQEFAIRAALGAGFGRLVRQLLTESVMLSVIGGVLGLALASAALRTLILLAPPSFPRLDVTGIDARVLLMSAAVSILTGA
jgi:putative ABC transport system permease protein